MFSRRFTILLQKLNEVVEYKCLNCIKPRSVMGKLMRVSILLIYIFVLSSFIGDKTCVTGDTDTVFVNWNKATSVSLRQQIASKQQKQVIDFYKNRLEAFYGYIGIKADTQLNQNSVRYKFLRQIDSKLEAKDIFIIEATTSGEKITIRNFVLSPGTKNNAEIGIYRYSRQGWTRDTAIKNYPISLTPKLLNGRVAWGKGFNDDDIIITHFQKGKVKASEFFLFGTLSNETIKKVTSLR